MSSKSIIYLGIFLGSLLGGGIANYFGYGFLSYTGLAISTLGSALGLFISYKLINR